MYIKLMVAIDRVYERLGVGPEDIAAFCRKWHIVEFALFGSVVRDDFKPESSDIDVMISHEPGYRPPGWGIIDVMLELEKLFGRKVDVLENRPIRNPYRRASIAEDKTVIYAA
jgi:uncharacterized protein